MTTLDLLVVGGVGIDTTVRVPSLPLDLRDTVLVPPIHDYVGHTGSGVALGCHTLGIPTKLIDFIGDDPQGRLALDTFAIRGLAFDHLVHPSGTRRSVNVVDQAGHRTSLYDGRHLLDLTMPPAFYLPFLEQARHVHLSIMNWARHLYDDAWRLGLEVSTDLHDWDGTTDYHRDFAYKSDVVFLSTASTSDRTTQIMRDVLQSGRARVVVATAGVDGSYLLARGEVEAVHVPAARLDRPIVDTNGAGDAFASGFLYGYLSGAGWVECARLGAIAGAYACGSEGTHTDLIDEPTLCGYASQMATEPPE
jgi:sugar/nucleoside kinase (ribokinase family)